MFHYYDLICSVLFRELDVNVPVFEMTTIK